MSEFSGEGDSSGETTEAPRVVTETKPISLEGISAVSGLQEGQPEVTDTSESAPAAVSTESPVVSPVTPPNPEKQFAPPGTGGPNDEALVKPKPSEYLTPRGIAAIQDKAGKP